MREIDCLCFREIEVESDSAREASCHQLLWVTARLSVTRVSLFAPGVAKRNEDAGGI